MGSLPFYVMEPIKKTGLHTMIAYHLCIKYVVLPKIVKISFQRSILNEKGAERKAASVYTG